MCIFIITRRFLVWFTKKHAETEQLFDLVAVLQWLDRIFRVHELWVSFLDQSNLIYQQVLEAQQIDTSQGNPLQAQRSHRKNIDFNGYHLLKQPVVVRISISWGQIHAGCPKQSWRTTSWLFKGYQLDQPPHENLTDGGFPILILDSIH